MTTPTTTPGSQAPAMIVGIALVSAILVLVALAAYLMTQGHMQSSAPAESAPHAPAAVEVVLPDGNTTTCSREGAQIDCAQPDDLRKVSM